MLHHSRIWLPVVVALQLAAGAASGHEAHRLEAPPEPAASEPTAEPATGARTLEAAVTEPEPEAAGATAPPVAREPDHAPPSAPPRVEPTAEPSQPAAPAGVPPALAWVGRFHPLVIHFPIALLLAGVLAELAFWRRGESRYEHAAQFCASLGASSAIAAAALGWLLGGFLWVDDEWVKTAHRWWGTGTAAWSVLILASCLRMRSDASTRGLFRFALFSGALLVSVAGFFGGSLLYGLDHFTW